MRYAGPKVPGEVKHNTVVQFTWNAAGRDFEEDHTVEVRCDNACARGVPMPQPLKVSYRLYRLDEAAKRSEVEARKMAAAEITCRRT